MLLSFPEVSAQRKGPSRGSLPPPPECARFNSHEPVKFPTNVRQTQHHPPLNQPGRKISATRPSGKCSFQEEFWKTEEGAELLQPIRAGFVHVIRAVSGSGVLPLPALRQGGSPRCGRYLLPPSGLDLWTGFLST